MASSRADYISGHWATSSGSRALASAAGPTPTYSLSSGSYHSEPSRGPSSMSGTRSRINHKNQVVCVTNCGEWRGDKNEPRPEYRDASRYYCRGQ